ncbi:MAG TPA: glutathione S-transferase family protein [Gammaproteobacteria bacterium]|nr:glutathione S-transferase family protein [Gammaproteobacteria bacterium]
MQQMQLVIGNKAYSSWSMRAWLALKHTGSAFQEIAVPLDVPGYKQKLLAHAPTGKVPVLKADGLAIWDSLAICEYLAERFPAARLWPQDTAARAEARSVSAEMHSGFPIIRREYPFNCRATGRFVQRTEELDREIARMQALWSRCREHFGKREPWLFGEFTIADCMYIPVALRFVTYGTKLSGAAADYVKNAQQHPAAREWITAAKLEKEVIEADEVGSGR